MTAFERRVRRPRGGDTRVCLCEIDLMTSLQIASLFKSARLGAKLLLIQIVFFQEFGPEILWRSGNVWPTLRRKVHQIPIRPHRVDMIPRQFSSPEMKDFSILLSEYMHHRPLHIIRISLAL